MKELICKNCSFTLNGDEDFCPNCEIPVEETYLDNENFFVCPVCETQNLLGEKKCKYCCSIL